MEDILLRDWYKLEGRAAVPMESLNDLVEWQRPDKRRIALWEGKGASVSTVFLGLDHQFGDGPPVLFETMPFGGVLDRWMWRYHTYDEAEQGHDRVVAFYRWLWWLPQWRWLQDIIYEIIDGGMP